MNIWCCEAGSLMTNSYLLAWGSEAIVVDVPELPEMLIELIDAKKLHLKAILLTHGHFDHMLGVGQLQETYPNTPCFVDPKDTFLLEGAISSARHFMDYEPVTLPIKSLYDIHEWESTLSHVDRLPLPGHTPGSIGYYFPEEKVLFSGDLFGKGFIGTYSHTYSSKTDMARSLRRVLTLPGDCLVYPGHGSSTTIDDERDFIIERIAFLESSGRL